MKLYVVTQGEYSDYHIEKIFLDKKKAENYAEYHSTYYYKAQVEEWETGDEDYEIIKNGYYCVSLNYMLFQDARFKWFYKLSHYQVEKTYKKDHIEKETINQFSRDDIEFSIFRYVKDEVSQEEAIEKVVKIAQDILTFVLDQLNQGASWEDIKKIYEEKQL